MTAMKFVKVRREVVTPGPDPTVVVKWDVTHPETGRNIQTQEFQNVYTGTRGRDRAERYGLSPMIAQLIHEGLEADYLHSELVKSLNEREEERNDEE